MDVVIFDRIQQILSDPTFFDPILREAVAVLVSEKGCLK